MNLSSAYLQLLKNKKTSFFLLIILCSLFNFSYDVITKRSVSAKCNFYGCSESSVAECNFYGCPNPPLGEECNFYGCPPSPKPIIIIPDNNNNNDNSQSNTNCKPTNFQVCFNGFINDGYDANYALRKCKDLK